MRRYDEEDVAQISSCNHFHSTLYCIVANFDVILPEIKANDSL